VDLASSLLFYGFDMPKGPRGEKRPADAAVMVARIATGEIEDAKGKTPNRAKGGKIAGQKRAERLSKVERSLIARDAAIHRWSKRD
jgi:hypothetical protein